MMSAKLVVTAGPEEGRVFPLEDGTKTTIGRGDTANVRLSDNTVSRVHCIIEYSGGSAVVKDCASKSGTRVNGKSIIQHTLSPQEVIAVGVTRLRFEREEAATVKAEETAVPLAEAGAGDERDPESLRPLSGTKLAHFDIGRIVAVGKSGIVFVAKDFKEDREVALKVYVPEFAEHDEELQRFIRAVKTMLPMRHPNVVTLYGGGKTGPYCWMAMEYVDGESLADTIARIGKAGKLDWRPALRISIDIGRGLFYIHSESIIHRNLTPGNILVGKGGVGTKLGSLILAKALSGALARDVTVGGEFLGDVRYQAPEQLGAGGPVDGRADIYSLGTLFYALLTGKPPFEGKSPLQTATMVLEREPTPPRQFDPHIPPAVQRIVLKMLAKKSTDRYQSAGDLLAELEELPKF
jgi:serine/threonine protein kinase